MDDKKETQQHQNQGLNNDVIGAILFTILVFVAMAIISRYIG